jgi:hypothetical protein
MAWLTALQGLAAGLGVLVLSVEITDRLDRGGWL